MSVPAPSIFRKEMVRYQPRGEEPVMPRFISTTAFVWLWIMTALLVAGGFAAWSAPIHTDISGVALVIDATTVVAFLPAHSRSHLQVGQPMRLSSLDSGGALPIIQIDPGVISRETVRRRFGLDAGRAEAIGDRAVVITARWEQSTCGSPGSRQAGHVYRMSVDGGSRPLFSVFPMLQRAWGDL